MTPGSSHQSATDQAAEEFIDWEPTTSPSTPPPPETLQWVESQVGEQVTTVEELVGGMSSAVHRLTLGDTKTVVLRRYTLSDWIEREPYIPHDEARNLALLGTIDLGVTTPVLVAVDGDGTHCDVPALLMTDVAGRPEIDPADPVQWAERLAECMAGIHEQPAVDGLREYRRWDSPDRPPPLWTADPSMWRRAIDEISGELPQHPVRFLHRDFHPNNVHWIDGEICAVVDWLGACNGPIAADLAHCRWNLAILAAPELAGHFTERYRSLTGYSEATRAYDLSTVLSGPVGPFPTFAWNALGRTDLTSDGVAIKIDTWLRCVLDN